MFAFSRWLHDHWDIISPRHCAICGCLLNSSEEPLCAGCLMHLSYVDCNDFYDNPVSRLFWAKIPIEKATSHIFYDHYSDSHRLLVQLKYNHRPDIGLYMGRMMALNLEPKGFFQGIEAIVPVPLHWKRQLKRGYNQSRQLALGISAVTHIPVLRGLVVRIRNNESQTNKSFEDRFENVKNLFKAKHDASLHHILLIDDVLTTSATLLACASAIHQANPDIRMSILTLAKTPNS